VPAERLLSIARDIDWVGNARQFVNTGDLANRATRASQLLAIWAKQLETADSGNRALPFMREAQVELQYSAVLLSIGFYKPAASCMRTMVESVFYYTYFRTHVVELDTLLRNPSFFIDKAFVLDFHRKHTSGFPQKAQSLGLLSRLEDWYGTVSAVIHGQVPGEWVTHRRLNEIAFDHRVSTTAVQTLEQGVQIAHRILLCSIDLERWQKFTVHSQRRLLRSLTPEARAVLTLPPS